MTKEESEFNDLNFLNEFKMALSYSSNISASKIGRKNKVNSVAMKLLALQKGNIISRGASMKYPNWEWISEINPNIEMVREMRSRAFKIQKSKNGRRRSKRKLSTKNILPELDFNKDEVVADKIVNAVSKKGGARLGAGRKSKAFEQSLIKESKEISIFWGMFKLKTTK